MTAPAGAGPVAARTVVAVTPTNGSTYITISANVWPGFGAVVAARIIGPLPSISAATWDVWKLTAVS
jgi:hypothetical protein